MFWRPCCSPSFPLLTPPVVGRRCSRRGDETLTPEPGGAQTRAVAAAQAWDGGSPEFGLQGSRPWAAFRGCSSLPEGVGSLVPPRVWAGGFGRRLWLDGRLLRPPTCETAQQRGSAVGWAPSPKDAHAGFWSLRMRPLQMGPDYRLRDGRLSRVIRRAQMPLVPSSGRRRRSGCGVGYGDHAGGQQRERQERPSLDTWTLASGPRLRDSWHPKPMPGGRPRELTAQRARRRLL